MEPLQPGIPMQCTGAQLAAMAAALELVALAGPELPHLPLQLLQALPRFLPEPPGVRRPALPPLAPPKPEDLLVHQWVHYLCRWTILDCEAAQPQRGTTAPS